MRTVTSDPPQDSCEWVAQLLPWYVNGTLNAADRWTIDAHCCRCERCAGSLRLEERIVDSMRAPRDNIGHSPQASWQRFEAMLDERSSPRTAPNSPNSPTSRRVWRSFGFRAVMVAQAAAIVALVVLLYIERTVQEAPRFHTLTRTDSTFSINRPLVRVALDTGVSEAQAADIASGVDATIVAGPSENNVYTFAFDSASGAGAIEDKVAMLRRQATVLLAEPVALESP